MFPEWITFSAQNWITLTALQTPLSVNTLPRCPSFPGLLSEVKDGTRSPTGAWEIAKRIMRKPSCARIKREEKYVLWCWGSLPCVK